MSAYQVSDATILLLAVNSKDTHTRLDLDQLNGVAQCLWDANSASLQARYRGETSEGLAPTVGLNEVSRYVKTDPVVVLKCAECFEYQACEYEGWKTSEAAQLIERVRYNAINRLPGYSAAPWGI